MPVADASRERLLDAALAVLGARGEAGLTLAAVAQHAGSSKALVLYHFGTRKRLLDALAERLLDETRAGLARLEADYALPEERAEALLDALFEEPPDFDRDGVRHVLKFWLEPDRNLPRFEAMRGALVDALHAAAAHKGGARAHRARERAALLALEAWAGAQALWAGGVDVDFEAARQAAGEHVEKGLAFGKRRG